MCCTAREVVHSVRPFGAGDLGRRVRVLWQGAEYRGRGRETIWQGKLTVAGNRIARFAAVNFLNPERKISETAPGTALAWTSVTTGNLAGVDLWLDRGARPARSRSRPTWCRARSISRRLRTTSWRIDGGGLGRRLSVYRLPEADWSRRVTLEHSVTHQRRRRPAGVYPRDAGRRQPGLDQPDLFNYIAGSELSFGSGSFSARGAFLSLTHTNANEVPEMKTIASLAAALAVVAMPLAANAASNTAITMIVRATAHTLVAVARSPAPSTDACRWLPVTDRRAARITMAMVVSRG